MCYQVMRYCPTLPVYINKAERVQIFYSWLADGRWHDRITSAARTDESTFKCKYYTFRITCIWTIITLEWLRKHSYVTCILKFHAKAVTNVAASESKFKVHYHDRAVCSSCLHTAFSMYSMYFVQYVLQVKSKTMRFGMHPESTSKVYIIQYIT